MKSPTVNPQGEGFGKKRILVAEAESPVVFSITNFLIGRGFDVHRTRATEETIQALRRAAVSFLPFHILIIDENLPGEKISLDAIRLRSGNQALKVVLISSEATAIGRTGFDAIVPYPVCEESLLAALDHAFDGGTSRSRHRASRGRILIVEDDGLSLELMKILLTKNGYEVELASNGMEAIELCKRHVFDLIFMDLQMPDMDGFATAAKIRETEAGGRRVPIIALTASNLSRRAYENLSTEFARILSKPFQIQMILETIQEFAGGQSKSAQKALQDKTAGEIDVQAALPHFGLDAEQYREILTEFQISLPGRMDEMEMAFQNKDMKDLARYAHNLKGIAANVGAMRISSLSAKLEDADNDLEDQYIRKTLDEMRASITELQNNPKETIDALLAETALTTRDK